MDELNPSALGRRDQTKWHPWKGDDVTRAVLGQVVGAALMIASWFEASGQLTVRGELTWLNLGLVGLIVCGLSNALWLLQGRRNVGTARVLLLPDRATPSAERLRTSASDVRVAVKAPGVTMFHRPGCPLVKGKPTVASGARKDRVPCQVCQA
ncbi:MAG TPA: hypothetical protein VFZ97_10365 [Acidimicrobiales bacterium]